MVVADEFAALKKKHSKAEEDTKYSGTVLGKGTEHGDVAVEGGELNSIKLWQERMIKSRQHSLLMRSATPAEESRPPSSALSSLGDRIIGELGELGDEMDLS